MRDWMTRPALSCHCALPPVEMADPRLDESAARLRPLVMAGLRLCALT
jgi:hypothetical protein